MKDTVNHKTFDVVAVGIQVIDLIVEGVDPGVFDRDVTTVSSVRMMLGGDALNQAIVLSRLGARTGIMGVVGKDRLGDIIISQLESCSISVFDSREDVNTAISIVMLEKNGDRHFLYQPASNDVLAYRHIDEEVIRNTKVVSVGSSMALEKLDGEDTVRLFELAKENGTITAADFSVSRDDYDWDLLRREFELCDYLLPSEVEAAYITGEKEPEKMAEALHSLGAGNVVIKLGEKGCYLSTAASPDRIRKMVPSFPCSCIDTTGAGDNFTGAFLYGVSRGWDIERCVRFGNAAGSIAVEHIGANQAIRSLSQVMERMERGN